MSYLVIIVSLIIAPVHVCFKSVRAESKTLSYHKMIGEEKRSHERVAIDDDDDSPKDRRKIIIRKRYGPLTSSYKMSPSSSLSSTYPPRLLPSCIRGDVATKKRYRVLHRSGSAGAASARQEADAPVSRATGGREIYGTRKLKAVSFR